MFKFIHAADIHLDSPLQRLGHYDDSPVELLRTATRRAVERLVDLAIEEQVAFVIIAGDLYDGDWDDARTGLFMVKQLSRLKAVAIPVFLISGNHDAASKLTQNVPLPDNVHAFSHRKPETRRLEDLRVAIHGQSFSKPAVTENLAKSYPPSVSGWLNIGLLHTSLDGREGHANYAPCSLDDLRSRGYDYWALGHIHKREVIATEPFVVFPGNLQGRHIRETGAKGAYLVAVDDRGQLSTEFRSLDVVRWERLEIAAAAWETADDLLDGIRKELVELQARHEGLPLAVRVEVVGETACHDELMARPAKWESDIRGIAMHGGGDLWIEKVKFRVKPIAQEGEEAAHEGPLAEVSQLVAEYLASPESLDELSAVLKDVRDKLPAEIAETEDADEFGGREWLRAVVASVEPLLRDQLAGSRTAERETKR
jgi:exonuclease SbcD